MGYFSIVYIKDVEIGWHYVTVILMDHSILDVGFTATYISDAFMDVACTLFILTYISDTFMDVACTLFILTWIIQGPFLQNNVTCNVPITLFDFSIRAAKQGNSSMSGDTNMITG